MGLCALCQRPQLATANIVTLLPPCRKVGEWFHLFVMSSKKIEVVVLHSTCPAHAVGHSGELCNQIGWYLSAQFHTFFIILPTFYLSNWMLVGSHHLISKVREEDDGHFPLLRCALSEARQARESDTDFFWGDSKGLGLPIHGKVLFDVFLMFV